MKPRKWNTIRSADSGREYLALLSYLPLKSFLKIPTFLKYTLEIEEQLRGSQGLLGYSLQAELLRRTFWTLSVGEDEDALRGFVFKNPHTKVMKSLKGHMEQTHFTRWKLLGSMVPPNWHEARSKAAKE